MIQYRSPGPGEARAWFDMLCALDEETRFMMLEPGERRFDEASILARFESAHRENLLLGAWDGDVPVGFVSAERGRYRRNCHSAYIVAGIRRAYRGQGIGTELFRLLDAWARESGLSRLELTVMCSNEIALRLYQKNGFEIEGCARRSLIVDGVPTDEYFMAKLY